MTVAGSASRRRKAQANAFQQIAVMAELAFCCRATDVPHLAAGGQHPLQPALDAPVAVGAIHANAVFHPVQRLAGAGRAARQHHGVAVVADAGQMARQRCRPERRTWPDFHPYLTAVAVGAPGRTQAHGIVARCAGRTRTHAPAWRQIQAEAQ